MNGIPIGPSKATKIKTKIGKILKEKYYQIYLKINTTGKLRLNELEGPLKLQFENVHTEIVNSQEMKEYIAKINSSGIKFGTIG